MATIFEKLESRTSFSETILLVRTRRFLKFIILLNVFYYPCDNSIIGGSFIIAGLYTVTWGSYRERNATVGVSWEAEPLIRDKNSYHVFSVSSSVSSSPKSAAD
jgi:hypothetical protein